MIIKIKPKNSAFNINKIAAALQKVKINDKTEWTGFLVINTDTALICNNKIKIKCKVCIIKKVIDKVFGMM